MYKYRQANGYDVKKASDEATIDPKTQGESLTVQSQAEDADINVMMKRFGVTGQLPTTARVPDYGDWTEVSDYRSALHQVMEAQENFLQLSPKVRAQFENDPQQFADYASDPNNIKQMREWGLAIPEKVSVTTDKASDKSDLPKT